MDFLDLFFLKPSVAEILADETYNNYAIFQ